MTTITNSLRVIIFIGIFQLSSGADGIIYVSKDASENETCIQSDMILRPCYSFRQLTPSLLSREHSPVLALLPGVHVIPENHIVAASDLGMFLMRPLNASGSVEIECDVLSQFVFNDVEYANIYSINFTSCTLEFINSDSYFDTRQVLDIENCKFTVKQWHTPKYVIYTKSIDITIKLCAFYNSGIHSWNGHAKNGLAIENTLFMSDKQRCNTALRTERVLVTLRMCQFIDHGCGAINSSYSILTIEDNIFIGNSAKQNGGAISSFISDVEIFDSKFQNNSAGSSGGAIYFDGHFESDNPFDLSISNATLISNRAGVDGGALYVKGKREGARVVISMSKGHSTFNFAKRNGGFAYLRRCDVIIDYGLNVSHSKASVGGAFYVKESVLNFGERLRYYYTITYNIAEKKGGALFMHQSYIELYYNGPVIFFGQNAVTSADGRGGVIFVPDSNCEEITYPDNQCFIYYDLDEFLINTTTVKPFTFVNNSAKEGSILYGGLLDRCIASPELIIPHHTYSAIEVFKQISNFEQNTPDIITSDPLKVCMCHDSHPNCSSNHDNFTKMRGQSITVSVAALDQDNNPVPSIITASYKETLSAQLKQGERSRQVSDSCKDLEYHIFSGNSTTEVTLVLEPSESPCKQSSLSILTLSITILPCSRGFEQQENTCVCDRRLKEQFNVTTCDIDTQTIQRKGSIWLRYDEQYLKIISNCPLDYCQVTDGNISLSSPDDQCANSRSGVLCGKCQGNYSIALGGSKCKDCTSSYSFIWLTVVFAVAGLALVALLLVCNITISHGTLNGLIFYANVVSTSGLTSLHNCSISPILSVFIAWVNLDLGVETCFYSGMDTYQKTWLQFAFPLYIWLLVVAIILASHYSSTAMKLFGSNNIAILATLFLLSYSKILKAIVTALSFTQVWRGAADDVNDQLVPYRVWTYDGNIEYLKNREHIALFIVAFLLLVFLFLPYTLMLLFGQCVRSMSVRRCRWVLRLIRNTAFISIMDAYHAPYYRRHRYWTGLMLLTRCLLFLVFATNATDDPLLTNMFTITLVIIVILIIKTRLTKVYKAVLIDMMEMAFLLNLVTLSSTQYYLKGRGSDVGIQCKVLTASISICFIMFLGILVYHVHLRIRKTKYYVSVKQTYLNRRTHHTRHTMPVDYKVLDSVNQIKSPTTTTVELREKLLESTMSSVAIV